MGGARLVPGVCIDIPLGIKFSIRQVDDPYSIFFDMFQQASWRRDDDFGVLMKRGRLFFEIIAAGD